MNPFLETEGPFLLEGQSYTPEALLNHSIIQAGDQAVPLWRREVFSFLALLLDPDQEGIVQKSSGSTGDPKSFFLSREAMLRSAERTLRFLDLGRREAALLALPVHYIAGKMMVVRALVGGLNLILKEPSSRPLHKLEGKVAFAALVPLQIEESLQNGDSLEKVSKLIIGGGELHHASREKLSAMLIPEVYETFGMTETYTHFALKRLNGPGAQSCFILLDGVSIGTDRRGCLEVDVPGVTSGRLVTNDLVEINNKGDGFTWKGRYDNMINSGGIKISPEMLEKQVSAWLGHECLVLSEPDRKLGNRLVLVVEFKGKNPPVEKWMSLLRERLAFYEIPRRILTLAALPRGITMKPDRTSARTLLL